ncbi:hypothetical protein ACFLUG_01180 [Chloroflexota bacterium]
MSRGKKINEGVKQVISAVWLMHLEDGWTANEIQIEVAKRVQQRWPNIYTKGWPKLRAVQKIIAEIQEEKKRATGIDNDWHMGTLKLNPLPSEVIPVILEVVNHIESTDKVRPALWGPVTVRQAIWISRLYKVISDIKLLHSTSWAYSLFERAAELSKTNFNSTELDRMLGEPEKIMDVFWKRLGDWARNTNVFMKKDGE